MKIGEQNFPLIVHQEVAVMPMKSKSSIIIFSPEQKELAREFLKAKKRKAKLSDRLKKVCYSSLQEILSAMEEQALSKENRDTYLTCPETNFTRHRILPLGDLVKILFHLNRESINAMLIEMYKNRKKKMPSIAAVCEARKKLKLVFFTEIYRRYTDKVNELLHENRHKIHDCLYKGTYRILAIDGSDFTAYSDKNFVEGYFENKTGIRSYNMYHLNALFNCMTGIFEDATIKGRYKDSERLALMEMVEKMTDEERARTILIADRGYQGIDLAARLNAAGVRYIIRTAKHNGPGSSIQNIDVPDEETYDVEIHIRVRQYPVSNPSKVQTDEKRWKRIPADREVKNPKYYPQKDFNLRLIKAKVTRDWLKGKDIKPGDETIYIYFETSISKSEMTTEEILELYRKRWNIEVAFRNLKKTIHAEKLHTRKASIVFQEIWKSLTVYNYIAGTENFLEIKTVNHNRKNGKSYEYKLNFTHVAKACMELFWSDGTYEDFVKAAESGCIPIRPGRHFNRPMGHANTKKQPGKSKRRRAKRKALKEKGKQEQAKQGK